MRWESSTFVRGRATTNIAWATDLATVQDFNDFAQTVINEFDSVWRPTLETDITLASVGWETATLSGEVQAGLAGGRNGNAPPTNCAALLSFQASLKGPRNRGRCFVPGMLTEGEIDEAGVLTPARQGQLTAMFDTFFTDLDDLPDIVGQAIAQSSYPGQSSPPQNPWPTVTQRGVQAVIGTQRRRIRR